MFLRKNSEKNACIVMINVLFWLGDAMISCITAMWMIRMKILVYNMLLLHKES